MDPKALIQDYLDGELTTEQFTGLSDWLSEGEGNREAFIRAAFFDTHLHRELTQSDLNRFMKDVDLHTLQASGGQADAEPGLSFLDAPSFVQDEREDEPITAGRLFVLAGYLAANQLRARAGLIGAFAAIIVLGLVLFIVLTGPDDAAKAPDVAANTPRDNRDPGGIVPTRNTVATLTAERDAAWAEGALAPGSPLRAGDRFTLTRGFAEITTTDGAVTILEAPCTVELIDHDNAIRLIAGRLVGLCETPSSKGLLVRAPHMDVTDLGTRFGVDATSPARTDVHVFEGKVEIERPGAADAPRIVSTGQSARASVGTARLATIGHRTDAFAVLVPTPLPLPGTGQGLAANQADTDWRVTAVNGRPIEPAITPIVSDSEAYYRDFPDSPSASKFISWKPPSGPGVGEFFTYTFETSFNVPDEIGPGKLRLTVRYIADNALEAVVINGVRVAVDSDIAITFDRWRSFTLSDHLVPGHNAIEFEVQNHYSDRFATAGQVGLRVAWELSTLRTLFERGDHAHP
ncbi:MAG: FecR domain-containing protein [Planctomycetota bacterium]